jgi:hypothetical protein
MSALPNAATLQYFDNSNSTPAPYGVSVPFNQENQDVWIGYDNATGQLCITNYNRTTTLVCFSAPAAPVMAYGNFIQEGAYIGPYDADSILMFSDGVGIDPLYKRLNLEYIIDAQNNYTAVKFLKSGIYKIDTTLVCVPSNSDGNNLAGYRLAINGGIVVLSGSSSSNPSAPYQDWPRMTLSSSSILEIKEDDILTVVAAFNLETVPAFADMTPPFSMQIFKIN